MFASHKNLSLVLLSGPLAEWESLGEGGGTWPVVSTKLHLSRTSSGQRLDTMRSRRMGRGVLTSTTESWRSPLRKEAVTSVESIER